MESLNLNSDDTKTLRTIADLYYGGNKTKALKAGFNLLVESHEAGALKMSLERKQREVVKATEQDQVSPLARLMAVDDTSGISGFAGTRIDLDCAAIANFEQAQGTTQQDINELAEWHRKLVMGSTVITKERFLAMCKEAQLSPVAVTELAMNFYGQRWSKCDTIANMCIRQVAKWADLIARERSENNGLLSEKVP